MPTFAAVDIGSNSVRLKIARLQRGRLHALHEDREVTRLGEGVFSSGFLTPESVAETVKVLRRFHRATQQVVTDSVRVVATSAMRDARNAQAFLEWVRSATGWKVEIVSGVEEARLIHLGLVSGARIDQFPTLMLDLGGGSCELTVSQGGHIRDAVSLPLGAVRLTNEFLRHDPPRKGELTSLRGFVAREVNKVVNRITAAKIKNVVATSGTAASLAAVASHFGRSKSRQRNVVSRGDMARMAKRISRLPVAERRKIEGIGPRRAEIIVAGAAVYHELVERLRLKGFRYSPLGLRDGILAQMAADYDRSTRSGRQIESERWESIMNAVAHYRVDRKHALDVRGVGPQPEQPPAEADRGPHALEGVGGQLLGDQANLGARRSVVADVVVAVDDHRAGAGRDDAAYDVDEGGLSRAVGAEQGEDLAVVDGEVHVLQRDQAGGVGLGQLRDDDDGRHRLRP